MLFQVPDALARQAKTPHELSILNLIFFHLLLGAGALVLALTHPALLHRLGAGGFALPLLASLTVIGFIHWRAWRGRRQGSWYVRAHWELARRRARLLLIAYAISGLIIGAGFWIAAGADKQTMRDILITIATRLGAVPILLTVMLSFVLESGALYQAGRGEVPDGLLKRLPPPDLPPQAPPPAG